MMKLKSGTLNELELKIGDRLFSLDNNQLFKRDKVYTVNETLLLYKKSKYDSTRFVKINT